MILTDDFVALNNPKTGSTFVRTVLKKIYEDPDKYSFIDRFSIKMGIKKSSLQELILPSIRNFKRKRNQHGAYSQIPLSHINKPVFSVVRNPYEKFIAAYEYSHWKKYPRLTENTLSKYFPQFPELNIDEYIEMGLMADKEFSLNEMDFIVGSQTEQFIYMFFKDPDSVVKKMNENYFESGEYLEDIGKIDLLTQENLNSELIDYLNRFNLRKDQLEIINQHQKVNENKSRQKDKNALMTQKFFNYIDNHEKYLFLMLKEFGINYKRPNNDSSD